MTLFDLIFLGNFLASLVTLGRVCYLLVRGRREAARRTVLGLTVSIGAYTLVLVIVSLSSRQKVLAIGEPQCFDDWCIAVEAVTRQQSIGNTQANGVFYVITARVSSRAKRRRQRETDVYAYLTDSRGRRFDVSPTGQSALRQAGLSGEPLTAFVDPGGAFESRLAFDVYCEPPGSNGCSNFRSRAELVGARGAGERRILHGVCARRLCPALRLPRSVAALPLVAAGYRLHLCSNHRARHCRVSTRSSMTSPGSLPFAAGGRANMLTPPRCLTNN